MHDNLLGLNKERNKNILRRKVMRCPGDSCLNGYNNNQTLKQQFKRIGIKELAIEKSWHNCWNEDYSKINSVRD